MIVVISYSLRIFVLTEHIYAKMLDSHTSEDLWCFEFKIFPVPKQK